jgi:N-carbamoylputrescine amidase
MPRPIKAAALQLAAHDRSNLSAAWPSIDKQAQAALREGAQLLVLPEGTLPAYVLGYEPYDERETLEGLERLRELAAQYGAVVVAGAAHREGNRVFNSAIVIDADGRMAGRADKHFLWHFDRQWFAPAEHIAPVQTAIGSIGALICADGRIPTISRTLVDRGAEILVMPTAWVTSGRDPDALENAQADLLARVRARENGVPFIAANKCGTELGCVAYCGKSQIISADGTLLAIASQEHAETITAVIEIDTPQSQRSNNDGALQVRHDSVAERIAITVRGPREGDAALLAILECSRFIYGVDAAAVADEVVLDPAGLVPQRLNGAALAIWRTSYDPAWQVTFARARALELRMYIVVIDERRRRAYAVDPDGAVICGTFGGYEVASFLFDSQRTRQTAVAPGTDVLEGLKRAEQHAR